MTDNEIKTIDVEKYAEALNNLLGVDSAYFNGDKDVDAIVEIIVLAKKFEGIIKGQKAEIERKTTECERLEIYMDELVKQKLNQAKAEAIKEFWEKAKNTREYRTCPYVYISDGNNLVKEMTEGDK